ncbi:MAG: hypothetical protein ABIL09_20130 [Gemmatimonadota bacterium]
MRWSRARSLAAFGRYNASLVFAGKFVYFLLLALLVFVAVVVVRTAQEAVPPNAAAIYYYLLVPGMLLVFYPAAYGLQSDVDARMLETLFGIPDYRYRVYLARQVVQLLVIAALLAALALLCQVALADFPVGGMVFHLMFPVLFAGSLGFMLSTLIRSGNGTAAVLVVLAQVAWILSAGVLEGSSWNVFHNPFEPAESYAAAMQQATTFHNRAYLLGGAALAILFGLLRLQRRERFM